MAVSSYIISFWFLSISGHFQITQENQNQFIESRKISCNWENICFSQLSKKKRLLDRWKKILISLITVYSTILVITKIYIFLFRYFTSGLLLIMQSQSASIAWTVTSTSALYHCRSYREHSDL